jgi:hypothetical protein
VTRFFFFLFSHPQFLPAVPFQLANMICISHRSHLHQKNKKHQINREKKNKQKIPADSKDSGSLFKLANKGEAH